jgi:hypothetical protein
LPKKLTGIHIGFGITNIARNPSTSAVKKITREKPENIREDKLIFFISNFIYPPKINQVLLYYILKKVVNFNRNGSFV